MVIRLGNVQLLEKHLRQTRVIVLTRMHDDFLRPSPENAVHRRRLDKLGTSTDNGNHFQIGNPPTLNIPLPKRRINEKNIGEPPSPNRCSTDINFSSSKGERFPPNKANLSLKAGSSLTDGKHQLPFRDDAIADPGDALSFPHRSFQTEKFHFQTEDIPRAHLS